MQETGLTHALPPIFINMLFQVKETTVSPISFFLSHFSLRVTLTGERERLSAMVGAISYSLEYCPQGHSEHSPISVPSPALRWTATEGLLSFLFTSCNA